MKKKHNFCLLFCFFFFFRFRIARSEEIIPIGVVVSSRAFSLRSTSEFWIERDGRLCVCASAPEWTGNGVVYNFLLLLLLLLLRRVNRHTYHFLTWSSTMARGWPPCVVSPVSPLLCCSTAIMLRHHHHQKLADNKGEPATSQANTHSFFWRNVTYDSTNHQTMQNSETKKGKSSKFSLLI